MMPPRKKSKNGKKHEISGETDRLSSLPDTLLITILSLLSKDYPLNFAATTSVLSHRWRYLWTQITHLYIIPWNTRLNNFNNFKNTVNYILCKLASSKLDTFILHFPHPNCKLPDQVYLNEVYDCLASLVPWLHLISRRNPEIINVHFNEVYPPPLLILPPIPMPIPVPVDFLQIQSLVKLYLSANIDLNFPDKDTLVVNLPNLKILRMHLCDSQRHIMDTLFRSCPLLEDLFLTFHLNQHDHLVNISAPNLKDLHIDMNNNSLLLSFHTNFVVDAPKLERLKVQGLPAIYDFVTIPTNLQKVTIFSRKIDGFTIDHDFVNARLGLFRGISCVREFFFFGEWGIVCLLNVLASIEDLPLYHNLVYLHFNYDDESQVDNRRPRLPRYWLANLKTIEVTIEMKKKNNVIHMKYLSYIISSATALEQLHVRVRVSRPKGRFSPRPNLLWNEYAFCRELFMHQRSSPTCKIQFFGKMITALSDDFNYNNDELTCKILKQYLRPFY